ncbi:bifunctional lysylphosphatidylglycerol synthetase/lysine--tRNA ligase LysX [Corynebacterium heidelbergense]|uniref:Lysine--tRNA ligase n=1 Tax=Corynebacterium heidelbergense TaxID=2055947 RepID=A0A364V9L2_9CORY|nr:bifunctional lysylphosphatidylglycerol synthetase/lysine--tRNA ligase LysX [Corynebacterium heidelbergense]RAV33329.1 lysine--tRNA ligase [Corynebacterium heidelbergense]
MAVKASGGYTAFPRLFGAFMCAYAVFGMFLSLAGFLQRSFHGVQRLLGFLFPMPVGSFAWCVVLFLLGGALMARKRVGWVIMTVFVVLLNVSNANILLFWSEQDLPRHDHGFYIAGAVLQAVLLVLLILTRRQFNARTTKGSVWRALAMWVGGSAVVSVLGFLLVREVPGRLPVDEHWPWVLNHVFALAVAENEYFTGHPPRWVALVVSSAAALVIICSAWLLLRSIREDSSMSAKDEAAVRAMIARFNGEDSLAYFATRRDKSVVYAPDGRAAVTYREHIGVCLASADPIGDPSSWDAAIQAWLEHARTYGWVPAVMGASERGARAYRRHGLSVTQLGNEAVVHTDQFRLNDPEFRSVRHSVAHAQRKGLSVRIRRHSQLSEKEMQDVIRRADAWRDTTEERGFSMALSRLGDPADGDCVLVEALQGDSGEVVGQLSFVPWGKDGLSLDLMRRARSAPNGTVETMVAHLCATDQIRVRRISLNFSVFQQVFVTENKLGIGPLTRLSRKVLVFLSRWWQMETLYRSNEKYRPQWVPRYICFGDSLLMPRIGLASGIAEGFVPSLTPSRSTRTTTTWVRHDPGAQAAYANTETFRQELSAPSISRRVPEQVGVRMAAAERMQQRGVDPWPGAVVPTARCAEIADLPDNSPASIAGRVTARRCFGGVTFLVVEDFHGQAQMIIERRGGQDLADATADVDLADLVRATGTVGFSRTGHKSLLVEKLAIEAKSLHPLPDKFHGLTDPERRIRDRHLELTVNPEARSAVLARAQVLRALRDVLHEDAFMEVETPVLQRIHGGANARPFITRINAYSMNLYLRIAPELYLKRLMCGGAERIFELGRVFRNEGVDATHNPEFTVLEAYQAHGDYESMRLLTQRLIQAAARAVHGECKVPGPEPGTWVDISGDWPVKTLHEAVSEKLSEQLGRAISVNPETPVGELTALCEEAGVPWRPDWDAGQVALEMYEHLVEETTQRPTFYTNFPTSVSPLTRQHRSIAGVTERWDLVAWGVELGTAYSELTDPVEQRRRLEQQSLAAAGGDPEAMEVDEDFLRALEFGMPPTGGLGLGVDRLVMLITGHTIRESLAFPLAKPQGGR